MPGPKGDVSKGPEGLQLPPVRERCYQQERPGPRRRVLMLPGPAAHGSKSEAGAGRDDVKAVVSDERQRCPAPMRMLSAQRRGLRSLLPSLLAIRNYVRFGKSGAFLARASEAVTPGQAVGCIDLPATAS